jgi:hypothetical protein
MKRSTQNKKRILAQTGAGGKDYTELDEIMLDILGRDTAQAIGLNQSDDPPVMPESQGDNQGNLDYTQDDSFLSAGETIF